MKNRLKDITPQRFLCGPTISSCPAVFKSSSHSYVIIGKACKADDPALHGRIGPGELAIEISSDLLEAALQNQTKE